MATNGTQRNGAADKWVKGLGWFSIGLGIAEVGAPRSIAKLAGMPQRSAPIRLMGVREIIAGAGILASSRPQGWMWARVGGDAMDLAALGKGGKEAGSNNKSL